MTTVAKKRRGLLDRWISTLLDDIITQKVEAVLEAEFWDRTTPCVHCLEQIPAHAAFCTHCGNWQEEIMPEMETAPVHYVEISTEHGNPERLYFRRDERTGQLKIEGKRPRQAYIEKLREVAASQDQWLLK